MIMKRLFILAAAVAMFAACTEKNLNTGPTGERIPLTLSAADGTVSSVSVATRSNVNDIQETQLDIASTAVMGIFVLDKHTYTTGTAQVYKKWNLASASYSTNGTDGAKTNINTAASDAATTLYYPDSKTATIDIYAYAPKDGSYTGTDISSDKVTVAIQASQNTNANYLLSDVLWGCVGDGTNWSGSAAVDTKPGNNSSAEISATKYLAAKGGTATAGYITTGGQVIIPMFHKASKIIIKLTPSGMNLDKLKGATVKFYVQGTNSTTPKLSTTLLVSSGAIDAVTKETTEVLAPITFTQHLGQNEAGTADLDNTIADADGTQGVIGVANTSMTGYACSGIILPQTISKNQKLIEIILSDNTTYSYTIPAGGSDAVFASEKVYTYSITLTASGLSLTSTVEDWAEDTWGTASTPATGNAELE